MFNKTIFAVMLALAGGTASAATIQYNDFSSTAGLQLNGSAAAAVDGSARNVLRVTPSLLGQSGSVFSTSAVNLAADVSFSTKFSFNFNNQQNGGADGLVFAVQTVSNTAGGGGGGIGYEGLMRSVGVEFDNWNNGGGDGFSDNHVGIDLNGNMNSVALNASLPVNLDLARDLFAWIDYNGATDTLEVRLSDIDVRPGAALLSYVVDLAGVLQTSNAYVGFTSGTGAAAANHDVLSWEFRDTYSPIDPRVPEPFTLALVGIGLAGIGISRKKHNS